KFGSPWRKHLPDRFPAINPQPIELAFLTYRIIILSSKSPQGFCYFIQFSLGAGTQFVEG
ncbi:MAG: hypothetical protein ACPGJO_09790, partial [bacterium]